MNGRPFAVHIGLPKCGSTYLQECFFPDHSEIAYLGPFSGYDEADQLWKYLTRTSAEEWDAERGAAFINPVLEATSSTGKIAVISRENLGINAAVGYREKAERLREILPSAKIVIVVREPVALIESIYLQHAKGFGSKRSFVSFAQWWKEEAQQGISSRFLSRLDFSGLANHYADLFGKHQVCVLKFEQFVDKRQEFFDRLCGFLGIAPWEASSRTAAEAIANPRQSRADLMLSRMRLTVLKRVVPPMRGVIPTAVWARLKRPVRILITDDVRSRILELYKEANEDFATRWGIDYLK